MIVIKEMVAGVKITEETKRITTPVAVIVQVEAEAQVTAVVKKMDQQTLIMWPKLVQSWKV